MTTAPLVRRLLHRTARSLGAWFALASVFLSACGHEAGKKVSEPDPPDLTGLWYSETEHDGEIGRLALEIEADSDGAPHARLSLLNIDVHRLPIGPVEVEGKIVEAGILDLELDASRSTLTGVLPPDLVPVHSVTAAFRPVESLPERSTEPAASIPDGKVEWSVDTGSAIWSGIALADGRLFFGNDGGDVRMLESSSGREIWRFAAEGAIRARPTVAMSRLFVQSDDGRLYCLDAASGGLEWSSPVQLQPTRRVDPGEPGSRYDHYASAAAVEADRVFIGSADGSVYAFDLGSGDRLWKFDTADQITSSPALDGGTLYIGSFDGKVYALDAADGTVRWSFDSGAEIPSSPAIFDNLVIVGSRSYDVLALDSGSGERIWGHYIWFSWVESSATIGGDTAYLGSSDAQRLFALDVATGDPHWQFDGGGSLWAQPAVTDSAVYIGAVGVADYIVDHQAAFWAIDRRTGLPRWKLELSRPDGASIWGFASSPAADGETAFVGSLDGTLYALSAP